MTAFSELQTLVSRDLSDPGRQTFDVDAVKDFIQRGLAEIARIAPMEFQEDLTPVASQLVYPLRADIFTVPQQEIKLVRVEVWRGVPARFAFKVKAKAGQPTRDSVAGWEVWGGQLELPGLEELSISTTDTIRIWGYSPYDPISADADVVPVSTELELAVRDFCRIEGMRKLTASRVLFKQWQARSNNTDVTLGQLNSDLQAAEEQWRRLSRALKVPLQNPD